MSEDSNKGDHDVLAESSHWKQPVSVQRDLKTEHGIGHDAYLWEDKAGCALVH